VLTVSLAVDVKFTAAPWQKVILLGLVVTVKAWGELTVTVRELEVAVPFVVEVTTQVK
jgi:hypothetical protein